MVLARTSVNATITGEFDRKQAVSVYTCGRIVFSCCGNCQPRAVVRSGQEATQNWCASERRGCAARKQKVQEAPILLEDAEAVCMAES